MMRMYEGYGSDAECYVSRDADNALKWLLGESMKLRSPPQTSGLRLWPQRPREVGLGETQGGKLGCRPFRLPYGLANACPRDQRDEIPNDKRRKTGVRTME